MVYETIIDLSNSKYLSSMKWMIILVLTMCAVDASMAQIIPDSLSLKSDKYTYEVYQGPMRIGPTRIRILMKDCPRSLGHYDSGRNYEKLGTTMLAIGAVFTIVGAGNYLLNGKEEISYPTLGGGLVLMGLSIPTISTGRRKVATSVYLFNKECARKP